LEAFDCHKQRLDDLANKYTKGAEELTTEEFGAKI